MRRWGRIGAAAFLAMGMLLGAAGARAAEELKIGAIGSLSGGGAAWGIATQRGVQIAVDEVNARGGLKVGEKRYHLRMIIYDDSYTGQGGTSAATRLTLEDGVRFIVGPIGSPAVIGAGLVANREKAIMLSNGFSPRILGADKPYTFRVTLTTNEFAPPISRWLAKTYPDKKRLVLAAPSDEVGQAVIPLLVKSHQDAGLQVVANERYERGVKDFVPILTRMLAQKPDILDLASNAPGDAGLMLKQARQLGYTGTIIQLGGPGIEEIMRVAGDLAEGMLSYDILDPGEPGVKPFVEAYASRYKDAMNPYAALMANGAQILFAALERAGTLDTAKVRETIAGMEGHETMLGKLRWSGKEVYGINQQILLPFYISEVKGGKIRPFTKIVP
jgi:branched-chain amino acid transport system substrate-binding protein